MKLRRRWLGLITGSEPAETLDLVHWISRATFDVIGLTGFNYVFNAIENEDNAVYLAYKEMFDLAVNGGQNLRALGSIWYPWLDTIWVSPTSPSQLWTMYAKEYIIRSPPTLPVWLRRAIKLSMVWETN